MMILQSFQADQRAGRLLVLHVASMCWHVCLGAVHLYSWCLWRKASQIWAPAQQGCNDAHGAGKDTFAEAKHASHTVASVRNICAAHVLPAPVHRLWRWLWLLQKLRVGAPVGGCRQPWAMIISSRTIPGLPGA